MEVETVSNVDEALRLVGEFGLNQILVVGILSLLTIPASFQSLITVFIADNPPWRCVTNSTVCTIKGEFASSNKSIYTYRCKIPRAEWEYVESEKYSIATEFGLHCEKENLIFVATSLFFAGMAMGSVVLGWLGDKIGRIKLMLPSTVMAFLLAFISSFSTAYWMFAVTRFILGFIAPGTLVIFFIIASEIVGPKYRPFTGVTIWFFFTVALVILGLVAMNVKTWKMLMLFSTAPYLILLPLLWFIPESLRWLHVNGRLEKAHKVLKRMGEVNGKKSNEVKLSPVTIVHKTVNPCLLFSTLKMTLQSLNLGFAWMVNALIYYGISLAINDLSGNMHRDFIFASLVEFPAAVVAVLGAMYLGRKKSTAIPLLLAGVCLACVSAIHEFETRKELLAIRVVLGMAAKFFATFSYDVIYTWTVELYPTQIRTEAIGYVQITSRLGAMLSPWIAKWLRKYHWRIPFAAMGSLAVLASLFLFWLPETKDEKTAEVLDDNGEDSGEILTLVASDDKPLIA